MTCSVENEQQQKKRKENRSTYIINIVRKPDGATGGSGSSLGLLVLLLLGVVVAGEVLEHLADDSSVAEETVEEHSLRKGVGLQRLLQLTLFIEEREGTDELVKK